MKRIGFVVLIAMFAVLSACGGRAPAAETSAPEKQATVAQDVQTSPTEAADAQSSETPAGEATVASGSSDQASDTSSLQLTDEATALKNLKSYKTTRKLQASSSPRSSQATCGWPKTAATW